MKLVKEIKEFSVALRKEAKNNKESVYAASFLYFVLAVVATIMGIKEGTVLTMTIPILLITPLLFLTLIYFNYLEQKQILAYIRNKKK